MNPPSASSPPKKSRIDRNQGTLLRLAAFFLFLLSISLSLAPAVRARTWDVDFAWGHWLGFAIWVIAIVVADRESRRRMPARDPYLLPIGALLCGWGLLTIWRVAPTFGLRQSVWLLIALGIFTIGLRLPTHLRILREYKYIWLTSGLLLTGLTLILGTNPSGAGPRLWLGCCGVYLQPSEPLKLLLIIYLASYLADRQFLIPSLLPLLAPTLVMTGLTILLLLVQRDLGTASIFLILYTCVIFYATGKARVLVISAATLVIAGAAGYVLFDVVRIRIEAWINPWQDPSGDSYQIVQSLLGIAAGGLMGRGPGLGSPVVVPVNHSDFIFTSIVEEAGLIGALGLIAMIAFLTARSLGIALFAPDNYRRYLAIGLTAYFTIQSTLIIGGNLRLLPLTGVTLPFVSYGGSSLVTSFVALLLLLIISAEPDADPAHIQNLMPLQSLGGVMFTGLMALAVVSGWWAVFRGPDLLTRTDNPRRAIDDLSVRRGALLDRRETPLNTTQGEPSEYFRSYQYPDLSPVLGYNHPFYGQAGAESSFDDYLRGLRGYPPLTTWWSHLVYGHPPPGLDIRLSLNLDLQQTADTMQARYSGAIVLMNAQSGEILALTSHPTFDANQLDTNWKNLIQDPKAPLINRATLGQYKPGPVLGPFLLAETIKDNQLPELPRGLGAAETGQQFDCATTPETDSWNLAIAHGCPAPIVALGDLIGHERLVNLYTDLGFFQAPVFNLETARVTTTPEEVDRDLGALGEGMRLSPLQVVIAFASLSASGQRPAPILATAVKTPAGSWQTLPPVDIPKRVFTPEIADQVTEFLASEQMPIWQMLAVAPQESDQTATWYVGGTLPDWNGIPIVVVVLLEENDPVSAQKIGQAVIQAALQPRR